MAATEWWVQQSLSWPLRLSNRLSRRSSVLVFLATLALYVATLAPTIYNLDSAELTTAAATGGLMRATGYPLYLLVGGLWSRLPVGDVGYRMNLLSAVAGALTIALAEHILRRLGVGLWARIGAVGLLAAAPYFWGMSLIAEVYTLHVALMAVLLLCLLRWAERPAPGRLMLVAGVGALSMGHHMATALLVPACVWHVLATAPRQALRPRALLAAGIGLLAAPALYLSLSWRYALGPAFSYAGHYDAGGTFVPVDLSTLDGLWWLVSGRAFAGQMLAYTPAELWVEVRNFGVELWSHFFVIGLGPGLLGMGSLLARNRRLGVTLLLMFVANAGFYISYRVIDKNTMFLPAYLIWALWVGLGYQVILDYWRTPRALALAGRGLLAAAVIGALAWNWPRVDLSADWSARQRAEAILQAAAPGALIFGWWDTVPVIQYLQLVEGERSDVKAINRFLISQDDMLLLIERESDRRPVYISSLPPTLPSGIAAEPVGPVYRLNRIQAAHLPAGPDARRAQPAGLRSACAGHAGQ